MPSAMKTVMRTKKHFFIFLSVTEFYVFYEKLSIVLSLAHRATASADSIIHPLTRELKPVLISVHLGERHASGFA